MKNQHEIISELQQLGLNNLALHRKNLSENAPEQDYDAARHSIMRQVLHQGEKRLPKRIVVFQMRTLINVAASLLLLAGLGFGFLFLRNQARYAAIREETIMDEYLIQFAEYDRNLFYEMVIDTEQPEQDLSNLPEDDHLIEYVLDSSEIQGIEPEDFLIQPLVNHQP